MDIYTYPLLVQFDIFTLTCDVRWIMLPFNCTTYVKKERKKEVQSICAIFLFASVYVTPFPSTGQASMLSWCQPNPAVRACPMGYHDEN